MQVVPAEQELPTAPQLLSSVPMATQLALTSVWPAGQASVHVPAQQVCPAAQMVVQSPHCPNDDRDAQRSGAAPPQSCALSTRQKSTQVPPMQLCVALQ
jgi:hypothetical protein